MNTSKFVKALTESGAGFFTGVPDSLLKDFGNYLFEHFSNEKHVITANEGNAIAMAAGSYIATGQVPVVYLQNSGLGNTVNPLLSMADGSLYAIPMIILVGWRGRPGIKDAEQHMRQGPATQPLIEAMGFPQMLLSKDDETGLAQVARIFDSFATQPQPYFLVVEEENFDKYLLTNKLEQPSDMSREHALKIIAESLPTDSFVVTTTGKTSREWYEVREQLGQSHNRDFLTVGSMGHTSSIALGMALSTKRENHNQVVCIDGDGSMLMHLGALVLAGRLKLNNYKYVLINNFSHESVGGLPTPLDHVDFEQFFTSIGFLSYVRADDETQLKHAVQEFMGSRHGVLEVRVKQGSRKDLARPNKKAGELTQLLRNEFDKG